MFKRSRFGGSGGFTLIELLLVASLVLVVSLSIAAVFLQGSRLYHRFERVSAQENEAFFLERLTRDLKNARPTSRAPFYLSEDGSELSFGTLSAPGAQGGPAAPSAGLTQVTYRLDRQNRRIERIEKDPYLSDKVLKTDALVGEVVHLRFETFPEEIEKTSKVIVDIEVATRAGSVSLHKRILVPVTS